MKRLDHDQLMQVAEALGRRVDGTDEQALRRSIADWVGEWANDVAEDWGDEDLEAARTAGRQEAVGLLEEEIGLLDESLTSGVSDGEADPDLDETPTQQQR